MIVVDRKQVLILAGPNGAGKTTFAREFLIAEANCPTFLNADVIAAELSPQNPDRAAVQAGRLMLQRMRQEAALGRSFAFETTLANRGYARAVREWQAAGYHVVLWFLALSSVDAARWGVLLSEYSSAATTSLKLLSVADLWPVEPTLTRSIRASSMLGCSTTIPRPSRCC